MFSGLRDVTTLESGIIQTCYYAHVCPMLVIMAAAPTYRVSSVLRLLSASSHFRLVYFNLSRIVYMNQKSFEMNNLVSPYFIIPISACGWLRLDEVAQGQPPFL